MSEIDIGPRSNRPDNLAVPHNRYLKSSEAAWYLRKSESWLLRRGDIPYLPGRPNIYAVEDLDAWFERNKHVPLS